MYTAGLLAFVVKQMDWHFKHSSMIDKQTVVATVAIGTTDFDFLIKLTADKFSVSSSIQVPEIWQKDYILVRVNTHNGGGGCCPNYLSLDRKTINVHSSLRLTIANAGLLADDDEFALSQVPKSEINVIKEVLNQAYAEIEHWVDIFKVH